MKPDKLETTDHSDENPKLLKNFCSEDTIKRDCGPSGNPRSR